MTGEKLVGFGASFDGSGLVSTGTVRELIEGTEQEHVEEDVFALGGVTGGGQGFAPGSQSVYGAFEALALDRGAQEQGALQHEATDQIYHETVVFSKTLTLPPVQGVGILGAHDQIHSPQWQESQIGEGPKAPVGDKHIASPQGATEQGKKPHLMILPRSVGCPQERA